MALMKQIFLWLGLGILCAASGIYIVGSGMVDFFGFRDWTKSLGDGAGIILVILFLIGGVFVQVFAVPRNTRKPGD
jgi:hypothetical protein